MRSQMHPPPTARFFATPSVGSVRNLVRRLGAASVVAWLVAGVPDGAQGADSDADAVRFNRDIRPLLSENCFHCHGPDEETRAAGLRLDLEEDATEYAIVPGDAEASDLMARILSEDPDFRMPPPDSERSLAAEEIASIRKWIDQGAAYQSHWAFVPPSPVKPPSPVEPPRGEAGGTVIDRFLEVELRERGLAPSPPADRETLLRRATYDLTGLPPTVAEIDDFLADESPGAYERVLDRLLADVAFGERMAADWLDVSRYSDTYGYQVDRDRFVWPWRDWVIRAFNRNLSYDRFITEQLAGDLLPGATRDQILATTFNRLHPQKVEGGSVPEEFRVEYVADRTQTFGTGVLGLTMECCRCHNHKYDPISQREYFSLAAFFDNIDEAGLYSFFTDSVPTPTLGLPTAGQQRALDGSLASAAEAERRLAAWRESRAGSAVRWAEAVSEGSGEAAVDFAAPLFSLTFEQPPDPPNRSVPGVIGMAAELTGDDGIGTDAGNFRRHEPFSAALWINTPDVKERAVIFHRSRAWTDAGSRGYQLLLEEGRLSWSLIHFWPGNAIRVRTVDPIPTDRWLHVVVTNDGSRRASGLAIYVDGRRQATEVVRDSLTRRITGGGGDHVTIGERFRDRGFTGGRVDEFFLFGDELTAMEIELLAAGVEPATWGELAAERFSELTRHESRVDHFLRRGGAEQRPLMDAVRDARRRVCEAEDAIAEIMVMRELPEPRPTRLLRRGMYDQPDEVVGPETPAALIPFPDELPRNRLGLARWLSDPEHPLTGRVAVNRLWQLCFGHGLVRTPEDFGTQGSPPTHPELLDWLAIDFVNGGWDVKRMLKRIMRSDAYRRSSRPMPGVREADPTNRWLARYPAQRLPAEMLRDGALATGGRLVRTQGGPPVRPYELEASFKPSQPDVGSGLYRRSLYTYWKRTGPAPAMLTLDAAKRDVCQVKREQTSSPLQALVLFNGPQYVEAARGLAETLLDRQGVSEADRDGVSFATEAYRTLTGHRPTDAEIAAIDSLYRQQLHYFAEHPEQASAYLSVGQAEARSVAEPQRLAAATVVVQTLMNFDRTVMKR